MTESVSKLTGEISCIMGGNLHSVWLYGSIVLGDFRFGWSDIDFIAFTNIRIAESQAQKLVLIRQTMAQREPANPYYRLFEGIIAEINEYLRHSFTRLVYRGISGQRILDKYNPDVFSSLELVRYGKAVYGEDERSIFSLPDRNDILSAIRPRYETIRKYAKQTDDDTMHWLGNLGPTVQRYADVLENELEAVSFSATEH